MKMLLSNLSVPGVRAVQNIASKIKKRRKFSRLTTKVDLQPNEDGWWELSSSVRKGLK